MYIIVRMNSTSGPWIVERWSSSTPYSLADIDARRWKSREAAQKAATKRNLKEKK